MKCGVKLYFKASIRHYGNDIDYIHEICEIASNLAVSNGFNSFAAIIIKNCF